MVRLPVYHEDKAGRKWIMAMGISQAVGWIGLGKMGLPICGRLKAAGLRVTVLARNEDGAAKAEKEGFPTCGSLSELAACEVIFSAVPDDAALLGLLTEGFLAALGPAHIFID
ncbi:MAG: hypothetical protein E5V93_12710, partial [Mesorhizobium sp.]